MSWEEAACIGMDPELFYPHDSEDVSPEVVAACHRCPVREACFQCAVKNRDHFGVWGGTRAGDSGKRARLRMPKVPEVKPAPVVCIHGHDLSPGNVAFRRGRRSCLQCERDRNQRARLKAREAAI